MGILFNHRMHSNVRSSPAEEFFHLALSYSPVIAVAKIFRRSDLIADNLFQLLYIAESSGFFPVKDYFVTGKNGILPLHIRRLQHNALQFIFKGGQEFLGHIRGPQQPPALRAINNSYNGFHLNMFMAAN